MVDITRLTGGNTPANGGDPRTFPAIWNATATSLESALAEAPVTVSATAPTSPVNGDLWWDTVNEGLFMYYTGVDPAEWIVAGGGGGASVTISSTAPADPTAGDMWWDSDNGNLYIYYDDGNSQQWVAGNGPQVFVGTTAPAGYQGQLWFDSTTGKVYIYYDDGTSSQWVAAVGGQNIQSSDLPAGSVLQVVSTAMTSTFAATLGSLWAELTSLTTTITPTSASSKILVIVDLKGAGDSNTSVIRSRLTRDNTPIYFGDASSVRPQGMAQAYHLTNEYYMAQIGGTFLDSPGTTSSVTYRVEIGGDSSSNIVFINRTEADRNATGADTRGASSLTLIEVAG